MKNGTGDDGTHDGDDPSARATRNAATTREYLAAAGADAAVRESEREHLVDEVKFKAESATKVLRYLEAAGTPGERAWATAALARLGEEPETVAGLMDISIGFLLDAEEIQLEEGVHYLPTGFTRLDLALGGGLPVPSLTVLGAAPKSGKSSIAQIIATRHVDRGGFVYYLDVENGRRRVLRQILCRRARLGRRGVAALRDPTSAVFASPEEALSAMQRWVEAKEWLRSTSDRFFLDSRPPKDFEARVREAREWAGSRELLVVVDSLQKLPGDLSDRRAVVDSWVRMFERLRHEYEANFFVVSEIKRGADGAYRAHESAFKESGGIEYSADLALTLSRDTAEEAEGEEETGSTLRVELARDTDEDPRGDVATFFPVRPFYGVEERDPVPRREKSKGGRPPKAQEAAEAFLGAFLASGPRTAGEVRKAADAAKVDRNAIYRARHSLGIAIADDLWRLS